MRAGRTRARRRAASWSAISASSAAAPPGSPSRAPSPAPGSRSACSRAAGSSTRRRSRTSMQGANVGLPYFDLDICRLRFFGGSTNHWAGRCRPLDELDFEHRPWVPLSGWPFGKAELEPYYREAQKLCQLGAYDYTPEPWLDPGQEVLPFDPAKVVSRVWQFSPPTLFGEVYRRRARGSRQRSAPAARERGRDRGQRGRQRGAGAAGRDAGRQAARRARPSLCAGLRRPREPAPAAGLEPPGQRRPRQSARHGRPLLHGAPAPERRARARGRSRGAGLLHPRPGRRGGRRDRGRGLPQPEPGAAARRCRSSTSTPCSPSTTSAIPATRRCGGSGTRPSSAAGPRTSRATSGRRWSTSTTPRPACSAASGCASTAPTTRAS